VTNDNASSYPKTLGLSVQDTYVQL
jgi:hypothetical protein